MSEDKSALLAQSRDNFGRIEVVPEILVAIAERNTLGMEGVVRLAELPAAVARRAERRLRSDGILLTIREDSIIFDIYVIMDANVSIMETARKLQQAVIEGINQMVGIPTAAVNVHVEDVAYGSAAFD